ncbi:hypothetical protein LZG75_03430 [Polynucleobacter sp. IMCC30063]|uniref:hypothetical protein n=1 Tax=Polynucleobacter sp. IMCC30063 TaxID=2907298 RepID=UPI001F202B3B|nr:hypothetical protein [Polynucleobacter sp. IMCC30063]MCE7505282.1 hypothetical protein [Polynucleobacter sp. IMCC30063]
MLSKNYIYGEGPVMEKIKKILRLEKDQRISFAAKLTQLLLGAALAIIVANYFDAVLQGYFFTFQSFMLFQILGDLALSTILVSYISHEHEKSEFNIVTLEKNENKLAFYRLYEISKKSIIFTIKCGVIVNFLIFTAGFIYFSKKNNYGVEWAAPWAFLCFFLVLQLIINIIFAILEGCKEINFVYKTKIYQYIVSFLSAIFCIFLGAGLWLFSIAIICETIVFIFFIIKFKGFFLGFIKQKNFEQIDFNWFKEIFPHQLKVALSWISGFLVTGTFIPIIFYFQGPILAGQFGISWMFISGLMTLLASITTIKTTYYAKLIAQKNMFKLKNDFEELLNKNIILGLIILIIIIPLVYLAFFFKIEITNRFLPFNLICMLIIGGLLSTTLVPVGMVFRAFKKEPFMKLTLVMGALNFITTIYFSYSGSLFYVILSYLIITIISILISKSIFSKNVFF